MLSKILALLPLLFFTWMNCHAQTVQTKANNEAPATTEVVVGKQTWQGSNLNTERFRNGDVISEVRTPEEWEKADQEKRPAWCYYKNNAGNAVQKGKLYNWYAVHDSRGLAPEGWHIPSEAEWKTLTDQLGGIAIAGPQLRNNATNFQGIAASCRYSFGDFNSDIGSSYWWTSTASSSTGAVGFRIDSRGQMTREVYMAGDGLSVRCMKD